jgi:S-DNA-T family DNA segregation ATPase FtsK/SpoIIIE
MTDTPPDRATPPARTRFRLDAVALSAYAALTVLAVAVASYTPLSGLLNRVGPAADDVARPLVNALGTAVLTLGVALFVIVSLYVLRCPWWKLGVRTAGWTVLTVLTAVAVDYVPPSPHPVASFGPGGAIGAYLRFALDDAVRPPAPAALLALVGVLGLCLVADPLVTLLLRVTRLTLARLGRWAARGNSLVARTGDAVLSGAIKLATVLFRARPKPPAPVTLVAVDALPVTPTLPIVRHAELTPTVADPDAETPVEIARAPLVVTRPVPIPPQLRVHVPAVDAVGYEMPSLDFLADTEPFPLEEREQKLRERAALLEKTFTDFGLTVKVVGIHTGPVITQYEISLDVGLRLSKVTNLADDLSLCLGVAAVRIVAPLPGRNTVGIEVPNEHRQTVRLKELILATAAKTAKFKLPIFLGKDVEGRPLVYDMASMPHLLIAGRTGTGKSVCLNAVILSFLYTRSPEECRLIMIDPKKVELSEYGKIPHLMHPVVTDDKKAEAILAWAVDKMEERYELLRKARVRNIASYNELGRDEVIRRIDPANEDERQAIPASLPYIVIIVDEVGDLLMSMKKEVEGSIIRLAQKSRAAGIHLILATQKPTVDVITGLIKSNLPARICFQVASRADSAVVLDEKGADKLLGAGDMLFLQPGTSTIIRAQGAYVDDGEIGRTVASMEVYEPNYESELLNLKAKEDAGGGSLAEKLRERDPLYEQAVEVVVREQRGSTSLLQRAMGIGYGKASRFIDFMAEDGIVGSYNGSNARDVLVSSEEWELRKQA